MHKMLTYPLFRSERNELVAKNVHDFHHSALFFNVSLERRQVQRL